MSLHVIPPPGFRLCEAPPDIELAERADAIAAEREVAYGEAMKIACAEDPALKTRYLERHDPTPDAIARRAAELRSAEPGITLDEACLRVISEDPGLAKSVVAYYEPIATTQRKATP